MSLTFYHSPNSTSTVTAAILAELAHTPGPTEPHPDIASLTTITLSIPRGDTRDPDYRIAVNPNGRVPALIHHGVALWESAALTIYLGETFGEAAGLYPSAGVRRGQAVQWIVWANTTLAEAAGRLAAAVPVGSPGGVEEGSVDAVGVGAGAHTGGEDNGCGGDEDGEEAVLGSPAVKKAMEARARRDLRRCLDVLEEGGLRGGEGGREFLVGEGYSLVDTHVWAFVGYVVDVLGVRLEGRERVRGWMGRVGGREALRGL